MKDGLRLVQVATAVAREVQQEEQMVDLALRARASHIQTIFDPDANARRRE